MLSQTSQQPIFLCNNRIRHTQYDKCELLRSLSKLLMLAIQLYNVSFFSPNELLIVFFWDVPFYFIFNLFLFIILVFNSFQVHPRHLHHHRLNLSHYLLHHYHICFEQCVFSVCLSLFCRTNRARERVLLEYSKR